jgi:hypothetical protein
LKENKKETNSGSHSIANSLLQNKQNGKSLPAASTAQLKEVGVVQKVEEEEPLQGKFAPVQMVEEEEPLQGKFDTTQLVGLEGEETMQGKFEAVQKQENKTENKTGLPDNLKSGIENLSGVDISDVKVNYNSSKPAQLNAHAFAQGTDIHVAPGQEKHLAHEAWHTVQQKQGRVQPTTQMKESVPVNDDAGLENEADVMGEKAMNFK